MAAAKKTSAPKAKAPAKATSSARAGRGTRWSDEQVQLLMDAVKSARTAREGFEQAAKQLGKNVGTVQQKYYNTQKQLSGGVRRGGRRAAAAAAPVARRVAGATSGLPSATDLRSIPVDDLVALAQRVKAEVERRKQELGAASQLFK
jgi:hypothetical protein